MASLPPWPSTVSLPSPGSHWKQVNAGAQQRGVVAAVAVDVVVAGAAEEQVVAVAAGDFGDAVLAAAVGEVEGVRRRRRFLACDESAFFTDATVRLDGAMNV
jgi:hypothetical protein